MRVLQPQPYDLVDQQVLVAGVGIGFEAALSVIVRAGDGSVVAEAPFMTRGGDVISNFQTVAELPSVPSTPNGFVEVVDRGGADVPASLVTVPVVFGAALIDGYRGFQPYLVQPGDTLSGIAEQFYGDADQFGRIFEANRDQIGDPNLILPGQSLRVPLG